ncbi:MAG: hypothetical protein ACE5EH_07375 [Gammaproteobacteria bacterium]
MSEQTAYSDYKLGETDELIQLTSSDEHRGISHVMADQANRSISIITHHLDDPIYNHREFIEALSELCRRSHHDTIRIILFDSSPAIKTGHRLIELSQRLSSFIKIRNPSSEHQDYHGALMVVDGTGIIYRNAADRYEGHANFNSPRESREKMKLFDEIWGHAIPDPELRRLHI